jgi:hypothetical protein
MVVFLMLFNKHWNNDGGICSCYLMMYDIMVKVFDNVPICISRYVVTLLSIELNTMHYLCTVF